MKVRIMGSADLVRAWQAEFEAVYGVSGREYPCRGNEDVRVYIDMDDRVAEASIRKGKPATAKVRKPKALIAHEKSR